MGMPPEVGAALSALIYDLADIQYSGSNITLQELLESDKLKMSHKEQLRQIIEQYDLGNVVLVDASWQHTNGSGEKIYGTMNAATFKFYPDGETFIAYRGTGDGNWDYNSHSAFGDEPSQMQEWARAYCDQTLTDFYIPGGELYLTGHSQGGNNAMYALLTSEYAEYVTGCISVDGPGFSQDVIDQIIREKGQAYFDELVRRCYGIYGENDYVHVLGEVHIIPNDQCITVTTPTANDFAGYHDIFTHFTDGTLNPHYFVDDDGNIIPVQPGPITVMVEKINESLLKNLSEEERYICGQAVMALVETLIGDKKLSNLSDLSDFVTLLEDGLPAMIKAIVQNPEEALGLLEALAPDLLKMIQQHPLMSIVLTAAVAVVASVLVTAVTVVLKEIDFIIEAVDKVQDLAKKVHDAIKQTIQDIKQAVIAVKEYFLRLTPGARYVRNNPEFRADTALMREYASRLRSVNSRLVTLDQDLNDLYWQVGLLDVLDILHANIIAGYSPRVALCRTYLNSAADALEDADRKVLGYMGG